MTHHRTGPLFLHVQDSIGYFIVCHTTAKGRPNLTLLTKTDGFKLPLELLKRKKCKYWFTLPESSRSKNFDNSEPTTTIHNVDRLGLSVFKPVSGLPRGSDGTTNRRLLYTVDQPCWKLRESRGPKKCSSLMPWSVWANVPCSGLWRTLKSTEPVKWNLSCCLTMSF